MPEEEEGQEPEETEGQEPEEMEFDEEAEAGPGRHLRMRKSHHKKGGKHGKSHAKGTKGKGKHHGKHAKKDGESTHKSRKLEAADEGDAEEEFDFTMTVDADEEDKRFQHHSFKGKHMKKHGKGANTPSKKELMKELFAVKKQLALNQMKLEAEQKFIEVDDKAIVTTKAKLVALVKAGADKATIAEVAAILAAEELKETETKKDMVSEVELIKTEKAEAEKLWDEIKSMKGNWKQRMEMMKSGDKKALWKQLMALKKEIGTKKVEVMALKKADYIDEKAIDTLKAKVEALTKAHASSKTIAEAVLLLTAEVEKDHEIKVDITKEEAAIKADVAEAKKIWAEIKGDAKHGKGRHGGRPIVNAAHEDHREHPHHRPTHEDPREELRAIVHEKEDLMHRERKDGWEKKFLAINEKKIAAEKEEIETLKKEKADPKKIEALERDLEMRWGKEQWVEKSLAVDAKMVPAEAADLEEKWERFEQDTEGRHHEGHHGDHHRHHGGCGHHGHHGHRHHGHCPVPCLLAALFIAHIYSLHKFRASLHALDAAKSAPAVSAAQVDEESVAAFVAVPITHSRFGVNPEDKQEYPVVSVPTNYVIADGNNMC